MTSYTLTTNGGRLGREDLVLPRRVQMPSGSKSCMINNFDHLHIVSLTYRAALKAGRVKDRVKFLQSISNVNSI